MAYMTDLIGEDYLQWHDQFILLFAHTGSGKTTFILEKLLRHAIEQNKYVLYLCNRTLLKNQIQVDSQQVLQEIYDTEELTADQLNHFIIHTYQYFEKRGFKDPFQLQPSGSFKSSVEMDEIAYVIWDEAHYLGAEVFNPTYNYWFDRFSHAPIGFPNNVQGTHVFLTATPEPFLLFLAAHLPKPGSIVPHSNLRSFDTDFQDILEDFHMRSKLRKQATEAEDLESKFAQEYQEATERYEEQLAAQEECLARWKAEEEAAQSSGKRIIFTTPNLTPPVEPKLKTLPPDQTPEALRERAKATHPGFSLLVETLDAAKALLTSEQTGAGSHVLPSSSQTGTAQYTLPGPGQKRLNGTLTVYPKQLLPSPYRQMPVRLFGAFSSLLPLISQTTSADQEHPEKWLVFVDDVAEGEKLAGTLIGMGISAVLLSAPALRAKKKDASKAYQAIVQTSRFESSVLISTSVMDCGVNIKDPDVRHVVISHSDRVTALQMLGRKRLAPGEQIHIYFRFFSRREMLGSLRALEDRLYFLVTYSGRNDDRYVPHYPKRSDAYDYRTVADTRKKFDNRTKLNLADELVYGDHNSDLYRPSQPLTQPVKTGEIVEQYQVGKSAFFYLLSAIYEQTAVLEPDGHGDPLCYARYQFSWIQQSHTAIQWVEADTLRQKLSLYHGQAIIHLSPKRSGQALPSGCISSQAFLEDCMAVLSSLPRFTVHLEKYLKKIPQKKAFNAILEDLCIPYQIVSHQRSIQGVRYTVWDIEPAEVSIRTPETRANPAPIPAALSGTEAPTASGPLDSLTEMFQRWAEADSEARARAMEKLTPKKKPYRPWPKSQPGIVLDPIVAPPNRSDFPKELMPSFKIFKD